MDLFGGPISVVVFIGWILSLLRPLCYDFFQELCSLPALEGGFSVLSLDF